MNKNAKTIAGVHTHTHTHTHTSNLKEINNHGITLTALVITVVIMIILVSVGINVSSQMQEAMELQQFKTKLEIMQTEAVEKYGEAGTSAYVQDNLKLQLDGIDNTGRGHNNSTETWYDLSGNGIDGTINGATWNEEGNGLYFDGTDDWVALDEMNYENVTIEAVMNWNTVPSGERDIVCNFEDGGYGLSNFDSYQSFKRNTMEVYKEAAGWQFVYSDNDIELNKKYSLSGSYDGIYLVLFENFNKFSTNIEGTIRKSTSNTIMAVGTNPGGRSAWDYFFNGTIYAVRIYDRALTDEEVEHNYYLDQIRFNIGADEEGYLHYTPEQLTKLGFTYTDQDAYINWETRQVKMYYNGEEYTSEKNTTKTNIDTTANTNFDMKIVYENNRYKVKVVPEENKAGLEVAYKKASSNTWLHADGYSFEYADYGTTQVKLYDNKGNETIKTITQTRETITTTGEMATLDGTLGEKVVSYTVTDPEVDSNIQVIGKNLMNYDELHEIWYSGYVLKENNKIYFDGSSVEGNKTNYLNLQAWNDSSFIRSLNTISRNYVKVEKVIFSFNKTEDFNSIVLKLNSSKLDPSMIYNLDNILINDQNYVFSFQLESVDFDNVKATISELQLEEGDTATEYESYTETNYLVENTSSLPDITTKKGVTHILVENTSEEQLAASYTYIKTVVE